MDEAWYQALIHTEMIGNLSCIQAFLTQEYRHEFHAMFWNRDRIHANINLNCQR